MPAFQAAVLGAVQGLTEFIPISSSGHLVLVPAALGWDRPGLAFDVLLHTASLAALIVYFSGDLIDLGRGVASGDRDARRLGALLAIGTIPAGLAGVLLGDYFERSFEQPRPTAVQLLATAVILVAAELVLRYHQRRTASAGSSLRTLDDLRIPDALVVGSAQAISILPGISRSGSTIAAGLALGVNRDDSARFAFLLAIPALFGATIVKIPDLGGTSLTPTAGIAGFVSSLVFSYVAIWGLIRYLRRNTLYPFAAYCVIAGIFFYVVV
ncbi:MAG: undecaprenyl-diphosphate phosphatase [Actinobacteria bacterium]|nr:undecaprenyl-diphosphate phosphatase [Actinomycetota bacterium]